MHGNAQIEAGINVDTIARADGGGCFTLLDDGRSLDAIAWDQRVAIPNRDVVKAAVKPGLATPFHFNGTAVAINRAVDVDLRLRRTHADAEI